MEPKFLIPFINGYSIDNQNNENSDQDIHLLLGRLGMVK